MQGERGGAHPSQEIKKEEGRQRERIQRTVRAEMKELSRSPGRRICEEDKRINSKTKKEKEAEQEGGGGKVRTQRSRGSSSALPKSQGKRGR